MPTSPNLKRNLPSGHSLFAWLRLRAGGCGSHAQGGEAISLQAYSWIDCVLARIAARVLIATSKAARDTAASTSTCSASNSPIVVSGGHMSAICEVRFCAQYRAPSLARSLNSFSIDSIAAVWSWFIYAVSLKKLEIPAVIGLSSHTKPNHERNDHDYLPLLREFDSTREHSTTRRKNSKRELLEMRRLQLLFMQKGDFVSDRAFSSKSGFAETDKGLPLAGRHPQISTGIDWSPPHKAECTSQVGGRIVPTAQQLSVRRNGSDHTFNCGFSFSSTSYLSLRSSMARPYAASRSSSIRLRSSRANRRCSIDRLTYAASLLMSSGQIRAQSSGLKSLRVTFPFVASSMSAQRSVGTGRTPAFHWLMSTGDMPSFLARLAAVSIFKMY